MSLTLMNLMMNRMRAALGLLLVGLLTAGIGSAQDVSVSVRLSRPLVKLGDDLVLRIDVEGTRDADVQLPPVVEGLMYGRLAGPQVSSMTQFSGGRRTTQESVSWSMSIRPTQEGEFIVPPVVLLIGGREVSAPREPMTLRVVKDLEGAQHCFIEAHELPERVYEGEPFDLDLRFGTDLGGGEPHLYLPWWPAHRGVLTVDDGQVKGAFRFGVNDRFEARVSELDGTQRHGVAFRVFQLRQRYVATRPGRLEFDSPTFQFSEVLQRSSPFSAGRYKRYHAQADAFAIDVVPVPEEGRPLDWTGAVGELTAMRRVDRRDVDEGGTIALTVAWSGRGNLEFFTVPDLKRQPGFEDFRVLAVEDENFSDERRVTYDLVPTTSSITQIPALPLWVFNPRTEAYEKISTEPVDVRVRPVGDPLAGVGGSVMALDLWDVQSTPLEGPGLSQLGGMALFGVGVGILLVWWITRTWIRRRRGDPNGPRARRRRAALQRLRAQLKHAHSASAQCTALCEFLADRTGEAQVAWLGRDVQEWAQEAGIAKDAGWVAQWAGLVAELDASAWSQADKALDPARILAMATTLNRGEL